ncbi:MAG: cysteine desulfurase-like protein [Anaerolineales bacterium]|nr:cysteine desulfurase-like protein [Anaerolineales bacterium]
MSSQFDVNEIRAQFPALAQVHSNKNPVVFLDNPGGTQVHQSVVEAMADYLLHHNANHGGAFATSRRSDAILDEAHTAVADMLNASSADEIVFGPNMTTLTLDVSRALAREIGPGDEIVVTRMDHDANISPWLFVAEDRGATVRWADFDVEDYTLDMAALRGLINEKTKIVAVGYASNALGTVNDVATIVGWAHKAGALVFVDAVQYAPHGPIDVQALDCDLLAISAYKIFGNHLGALYGKYDLLDRLQAYKVRPAPNDPPGKYETGTQNHEGIAGTLAAVNYLTEIGEKYGQEYEGRFSDLTGRRLHLKTGMTVLREYDHILSAAILDELESLPGVRIHGITDRGRLTERVPTVSFTWEDRHPRDIAVALGEQGIFCWDGNYYAVEVTTRLGLEAKGGMVRIGAVHYNTVDEIRRLGDALRGMA